MAKIYPSLMLPNSLDMRTMRTFPSVALKKVTYSAFVELHIEQGPILEEEGWIAHHVVIFFCYDRKHCILSYKC